MEKENPLDDDISKKQGQEDSYDEMDGKPFIPINPLTSINIVEHDNGSSATFTRDKVFNAVSQGDTDYLKELLPYLLSNDKKLSSPEFVDDTSGETALMKALLNFKDGKNDTIEILLDIAEKTQDNKLINAPQTDHMKGQTALHVAIERRSLDLVKLLVQKGADVQAKADGTFFQNNGKQCFYFGELPLSLAACTDQPDIVSFLVENPYRRADLTDKDSQGNTVLHALVIVADDSDESTKVITKIYDDILVKHNNIWKDSESPLEDIENNQGLTPLKLAAKLGKKEVLEHMLNRQFTEEKTWMLSRKFPHLDYGPVHSSLYDISSIDTSEPNSVLEIIVYGNNIPNRPEMIKLEPLRSLLRDKWERFGAKLFFLNFLSYLIYLTIFTTVAFYRKEGQPPFPVENHPFDYLRCVGELISVFGAIGFLCRAIAIFHKKPPNLHLLFTDGVSEILFFLQAALLLLCSILYFSGRKEYVSLLVLSLSLAWINILYYTRGSKQLGIYYVMMQRMILNDLFHFLFVYCVLLIGFSAAVVTLMDNSPAAQKDTPVTVSCEKPTYNHFGFTTLELFKFTIGMGDLEFINHIQYKEVFHILLIFYIILTYILMLNMLIALMGNTVEEMSGQSKTIWKLQRAFTILEMEKVPAILRNKIESKDSKFEFFKSTKKDTRKFVRVTEINWTKWRSDISFKMEVKPEKEETETKNEEPGSRSSSKKHHSKRGQQQGIV
ncbi:transient receptor potential cation channel subfamily V member 1 [Oryzias melastigma]|uniref:transient receptor potential cation channel subfamily V member 1 n=1 Tax=Oryzias melastigma TaxID=30732 RepID=UPI000CF7F79A|nr:transient receptor potential cation channel subfamily V member 1 [Oryzias melastigma]